MQIVLLVIHILLALALIGVVLLQRSEGGGLGIGGSAGGGGGGMAGFLTGRGTANLLTRTTAILAACFMATSILLTIIAGGGSEPRSILDSGTEPAPHSAPMGTTEPAVPSEPTVPAQ